jgi:DNA-directed RNA polymerase subunit L
MPPCSYILSASENSSHKCVLYDCCSPDVSFVGYSIPHPSEPKMNIRLQTKGKPAVELLRWGLQTIKDMCDHISEQAEEALPA